MKQVLQKSSTKNLIVVHGEDLQAIDGAFHEYTKKARENGSIILEIDLSVTELSDLSNLLDQESLFGGEESRLIVIRSISILRKKAEIDQVVSNVNAVKDDVLIIQFGKLGKKILDGLSSLSSIKVVEKRLKNPVFQWIETFALKPLPTQLEMLHRCYEIETPEFCLAILLRQLRFMLELAETGKSSAPPFSQRVISSQLSALGKVRVNELYKKAIQLDLGFKTTTLRLDLRSELDLLHLPPVR